MMVKYLVFLILAVGHVVTFGALQIERLATQGHQINERLGRIEGMAKLTGRVVGRKRVVVVVEALAQRPERHPNVLGRSNVRVVRLVAEHMRRTVDEECTMVADDMAAHH